MLLPPRTPKLSAKVPADAARLQCSLKRDGHLLRICKDTFGRVHLWSRRPTDLTEKLRWHQLYHRAQLFLAPGSQIVGELWAPGHRASDVKTIINERGLLVFEAFAIEWHRHEEWAGSFEDLEWQLYEWGFSTPPLAIVDRLFETLPRDAEGYVLKRYTLSDWFKLKPEPTVDLVVHGLKDGKGKNLGLLGSLECGLVDGTIIANVSGMTDDERIAMTREWHNLIGRVVEVQYQYVGSRGRLRHPRFVRWRDDKSPAECDGRDLPQESDSAP